MYRILIADDELKIRTTLFDYMTVKGLSVTTAADGLEAVELCGSENYDLIILDVLMPRLDGIVACKEIREYTDCPILFLSALGEEQDLLKGFSNGADDYIIKPFPLSVLYEKCLAMIKRYRGTDKDNKITISSLTLDFVKRSVTVNGEIVKLSNTDFELLSYLMQNKGIVLSRELILTKVWGYDFEGDTRVVDTHIKRIRKALGSSADVIKTSVGIGYYAEEVLE